MDASQSVLMYVVTFLDVVDKTFAKWQGMEKEFCSDFGDDSLKEAYAMMQNLDLQDRYETFLNKHFEVTDEDVM